MQASRSSVPRVLVIGLGNASRRDDAVGLVAAERLQQMGLPGVEVTKGTDDLTALLDLWGEEDTVVLIDAISSQARPGAIRRLNVLETDWAALPTLSSHGVALPTLVALAQRLGRLPRRLLLYGVEVASFSLGIGLSPPVAVAVETVVARVAEEVACTSSR